MHPAAGTSESWEQQLGPLGAAGYRCITYDLRGWGKSQVLDTSDMGTCSDDLEVLVNSLHLAQFILIAAAYGGFGGLDYALRFQSRLRALVLTTTQAGLADPDYRRVLERAVPEPIRRLPPHLRELGPSYRAENQEGVERWLAIERQAHAEPARRQRLHLEISLRSLESLPVPTLLIAGGADLLAPPALMRLLAARLPVSTFEVIAEAGHSAHWERPAEWNRLVLDFLARR
jgi:pimeloyl-ACP methyl ester carboxylesterase